MFHEAEPRFSLEQSDVKAISRMIVIQTDYLMALRQQALA
jgi:hypothetical protein